MPFSIDPWFSEDGPQTSYISIIWKLLEKQILRPLPRPTESEILGEGPEIYVKLALQMILMHVQV